eukprot:scaffold743_cov145-Skeletonema_menzelii.AAC.6
MKIGNTALLLALAAHESSSFSLQLQSVVQTNRARISHNKSISRIDTSLFSTVVEQPPAEAEEVYGTIVGDTKGAALFLNNVAISRGAEPLLKDINWSVQPNERWGIVGVNGAGKSTLLGAITGTVRMDSGKALVHSNVRVGYMRQTAVSGSTKTVYEEAKSEMTALEDARQVLDIVTKRVEDGDYSEEALDDLANAQELFQNLGGYEQEQMGVGRCELGWRDCCDSAARDWLGKYIANYDGSVVLVSHDVSLMDASVNNIVEITAGTLIEYKSCSYNRYLEEKEFRALSAQAEYEKNLEEAAQLQKFIDKFSAGTKSKSAQSRVKALERMKKEGRLDPPPAAVVTTARIPYLKLPAPPKPHGENLLVLKDATIGYNSEEKPLLENISLTIPRGMKLLLRGPNGAGKSTLLKALRGNVPSMIQQGSRIENQQLKLGVFTQDLAQELDKDARAVDLVTDYARTGADGDITISDEDARRVMGALGLTGEKSLRQIKALSGGEKARDVGCIQGLANALSGWGGKDGAVVIISHDREFCDRVDFTHIGTVIDGKLKLEQRSLQESDWEQYDIGAKLV